MAIFTVYGRPGCGYCHMACRVLEQGGQEYEYIDMYQQGISKQDLEKSIGRPAYTVPQIMHGDQYVGGFSDLVPYLKSI